MSRRSRGRPVHGWLIVDKPAGPTSAAVVAKAKWALGAAKAGHAGTLDPAATGLLALAFGEATKTVPFVADARKAYRFTVRWGAATADRRRRGRGPRHLRGAARRRTAIRAALPAFTGDILQVPPQVSAVKVEGARAYDLARAGETLDLAAAAAPRRAAGAGRDARPRHRRPRDDLRQGRLRPLDRPRPRRGARLPRPRGGAPPALVRPLHPRGRRRPGPSSRRGGAGARRPAAAGRGGARRPARARLPAAGRRAAAQRQPGAAAGAGAGRGRRPPGPAPTACRSPSAPGGAACSTPRASSSSADAAAGAAPSSSRARWRRSSLAALCVWAFFAPRRRGGRGRDPRLRHPPPARAAQSRRPRRPARPRLGRGARPRRHRARRPRHPRRDHARGRRLPLAAGQPPLDVADADRGRRRPGDEHARQGAASTARAPTSCRTGCRSIPRASPPATR